MEGEKEIEETAKARKEVDEWPTLKHLQRTSKASCSREKSYVYKPFTLFASFRDDPRS